MIDFYPGQRVVCVDAKIPDPKINLVEGQIYTIRDVGPLPMWQVRSEHVDPTMIGVRLHEIDRMFPWMIEADRDDEPMFRATRFRPLIKTDISVFTALLNTAPLELEPV